MSPIMRSCSPLLLATLSLASFSSGIAVSSRSDEGSSINGRIKISGLAAKAFGIPGKLPDAKVTLNGGSMITFLRARNPGKVLAALTETRQSLSELVLEPLRDEQYYEIREPFSLMSLVKIPMGLMVGFMLVVMFLMPKLAGNMDSEEMRRTQEEMRSQGVPSLANMLAGAAR